MPVASPVVLGDGPLKHNVGNYTWISRGCIGSKARYLNPPWTSTTREEESLRDSSRPDATAAPLRVILPNGREFHTQILISKKHSIPSFSFALGSWALPLETAIVEEPSTEGSLDHERPILRDSHPKQPHSVPVLDWGPSITSPTCTWGLPSSLLANLPSAEASSTSLPKPAPGILESAPALPSEQETSWHPYICTLLRASDLPSFSSFLQPVLRKSLLTTETLPPVLQHFQKLAQAENAALKKGQARQRLQRQQPQQQASSPWLPVPQQQHQGQRNTGRHDHSRQHWRGQEQQRSKGKSKYFQEHNKPQHQQQQQQEEPGKLQLLSNKDRLHLFDQLSACVVQHLEGVPASALVAAAAGAQACRYQRQHFLSLLCQEGANRFRARGMTLGQALRVCSSLITLGYTPHPLLHPALRHSTNACTSLPHEERTLLLYTAGKTATRVDARLEGRAARRLSSALLSGVAGSCAGRPGDMALLMWALAKLCPLWPPKSLEEGGLWEHAVALMPRMEVEAFIQLMTAAVIWKLDSRPAVAEAAAAALLTRIAPNGYSRYHQQQQQQQREQYQQADAYQQHPTSTYHNHQQALGSISVTNAFRLLLSFHQCCYSPPVRIKQWLLQQLARQFLILDAFQVKQLQHLTGVTRGELWRVVEEGVRGALRGRSVGELVEEHAMTTTSSSSNEGCGERYRSNNSSSTGSRNQDDYGGNSSSRRRRRSHWEGGIVYDVNSSGRRGRYDPSDTNSWSTASRGYNHNQGSNNSSTSSSSSSRPSHPVNHQDPTTAALRMATASVVSAAELLMLVKFAVLLGGRTEASPADGASDPGATGAAGYADPPLSWSGVSNKVSLADTWGQSGGAPPSSSSSSSAAAAVEASTEGVAGSKRGSTIPPTSNSSSDASHNTSSSSSGCSWLQQQHDVPNDDDCPASVALVSDLLAAVGRHPKWLQQHCSLLDLLELLWSAAVMGVLGDQQQQQPSVAAVPSGTSAAAATVAGSSAAGADALQGPLTAVVAAAVPVAKSRAVSDTSSNSRASATRRNSSSSVSSKSSQQDVAHGIDAVAHALVGHLAQLKPMLLQGPKPAVKSYQLKALGLTPGRVAQLVRAVSLLQLRVPELLEQLTALVRVQAFGLNPSSLAGAAWVLAYQFKWPCMGMLQSVSQALLRPVPEQPNGRGLGARQQQQQGNTVEEGGGGGGAEVGILYSMDEGLEGPDKSNSSILSRQDKGGGVSSRSKEGASSAWDGSSNSSTSSSDSGSNIRCGLHLLGAADVAGLSVALASAGWGSPQLLGELADCAEGLVGDMDGQQLAQLMWGFARAGFYCPSLLSGATQRVQQLLSIPGGLVHPQQQQALLAAFRRLHGDQEVIAELKRRVPGA